MTCRCNCGYTCGGPGVCELEMLDCIEKHWVRDCEHEFTGWVELKFEGGGGGGSTVCKHCGVTSMGHDMLCGP